MKIVSKAYVILAAAVLTATLSCTERLEGVGALRHELSFVTETRPAGTRGFVTGSELSDDLTGDRTLHVSAYHHAQSGEDGDYFVEKPFGKDGSAWRANPSVYWPVGGRLDFLAYSSSVPFVDGDVRWGSVNAAERMRIRVDDTHTQDDILFGGTWNSVSAGGATTSLGMSHSQAWIEVRFRLGTDCSETGIVRSVKLKDIYTDGILDVENNYGLPVMSWDFRSSSAKDRTVDDTDGVYGTALGTSFVSVRMLIPEQRMTSIIVDYSIGDEDKVSEIELTHANWIAGRNYVYEYVIGPDKDPFNGHVPVDLGIRVDVAGVTNKLLFAATNIGADSPEEYGDYFAWAESSVRDLSIPYNLQNCPYHEGSGAWYGWLKYVSTYDLWGGTGSPDYLTRLQEMDDAAAQLWEGGWRMPTKDDFLRLINNENSTHSFVNDYKGTGVNGILFSGINDFAGNELFLPAAGFRDFSDLYSVGTELYYWSSDVYASSSAGAYFLSGSSTRLETMTTRRDSGHSIRPVILVQNL